MKFSESWLREWVNPNITTHDLVAQLTMAGLEVDAVEPAAGPFSGVVVGEIVAVAPHPNAEKLQVCQVRGAAPEPLQVVCGAANARVGIKVPFATVGARLPGDVNIQQAKLRGVESFGMLCAQTELRVGDDDSGLWELPATAPVGEDLRTYLDLDDVLIEVDLTPNRGDCLSVRGIAREVAVLNRLSLNTPAMAAVAPSHDAVVSVAVAADAQSACPNYVGRVLRNIRLDSATPAWMQEKLRRSGVRSIDPVVDVTNYVLLELGQPMHAFDLEKLDGDIQVRFANAEETLILLNDQSVTLQQGTLVIADSLKPLAIAGVMGGRDSAVSDATQSIFLESAFFTPLALAGKARGYGLHTDSSHRFERGVDPQLQILAIERATQLLMEIVGGEPGPLVRAAAPTEQRPAIPLTRERLQSGLNLSPDQVDAESILNGLGLTKLDENAEGWSWQAPSFRFDLSIEEDLLEEIARIYGYDRLPTRIMSLPTALPQTSEVQTATAIFKRHLASRGYQEIISYSFIDPKLHQQLYPDVPAIALRNPISADLATMRTSLIPGLLLSLQHNLNRQQTRARLFEVGMVFDATGERNQAVNIGGLVYGSARELNWAEKAREVDFFDLKGDLESLLNLGAARRTIEFVPLVDDHLLHPGQSATVLIDGLAVGKLGALHPQKTQQLGLNKSVYVFECLLSAVSTGQLPKFAPVSRFPEVSRDLAVLVEKQCCVADLCRNIRKSAGDVLKDLKLFDVYSGEGIDSKRKSVAFSLIFQHPSRTLKDEEINASMAAVMQALAEEFDASLR